MKVLLSFIAASALSVASAGTLTLAPALVEYQQSNDNPCIFGPNGGACPIGDLDQGPGILAANEASSDVFSPMYTVADIRDAVGDEFLLGLDVNQTNQSSPQTLSLLQILINGIVVDDYVGATLVPTTPVGSNGIGFADYTFSNITSLAALADGDTVQFHLVMPDRNDGPEQLFFIATEGGGGGGGAVPEPATLAMLGAGCLVLGYRRFRQAK